MNIASIIVVFFLSWWIILFMVLPIGVRRDDEVIEGNDTGAPVKHMLGKKMLWATIGAFAVLSAFWVSIEIFEVSLFRD